MDGHPNPDSNSDQNPYRDPDSLSHSHSDLHSNEYSHLNASFLRVFYDRQCM